MQTKFHNLSLIIERCPNIPGQWIAHVLDFDIFTQGRSLQHILEMVLEASLMVVEAEAKIGRDPLVRRAPDEFWARWREIVLESTAFASPARSFRVNESEIGDVAAQFQVIFQIPDAPVYQSSAPPKGKPSAKARNPLLWRTAA